MSIHGYYISGSTCVCYILVIVFALLTVYELKKQSKLLSNKTINLQRQFEKTLVSQVCFYEVFKNYLGFLIVDIFIRKTQKSPHQLNFSFFRLAFP